MQMMLSRRKQTTVFLPYSRKETCPCLRAAVEFVANTVIFVVCGMLIAGRVYGAHQPGGPWTLQGRDYAFAVALWLLLLVCSYLAFPSFVPFPVTLLSDSVLSSPA